MFGIILLVIIALVILLAISSLVLGLRKSKIDWKGKHVCITGGSAGLGLSFAKKLAKEGARISILARNVDVLQKAADQIIECSTASESESTWENVAAISCDVADYKITENAIKMAERKCGPIDVLVCSAGLAMPGYFISTPVETFYKEIEVNYYGIVHAVKAVLPGMVARGRGGRIVLVSSACGLLGFIGYSMYCPSKFAVRGLADCLRNELLNHKIDVHIFYPSSMDTPGFEVEERTKPKECREIEGTAKLLSADDAAQTLYDGVSRGQYHITSEVLVEFLRFGMNGITPRNFPFLEGILLPLCPLFEYVYRVFVMDRTVLKARGT